MKVRARGAAVLRMGTSSLQGGDPEPRHRSESRAEHLVLELAGTWTCHSWLTHLRCCPLRHACPLSASTRLARGDPVPSDGAGRPLLSPP